jgi:hypothetical protein
VTVAARQDSRSEATVPELPDIAVYIEALEKTDPWPASRARPPCQPLPIGAGRVSDAPDLGGWERDSGSQSAQGRLIEGNRSAVELGQVADDG